MHKSYIRYVKHSNKNINDLFGGGNKYTLDYINKQFDIDSNMYKTVAFNDPQRNKPNEMSEFYMPLISYAYFIVKNDKDMDFCADIPENLYKELGSVIKITHSDMNIAKNIFKIMIVAICNYLDDGNNLKDLDVEYSKDKDPIGNKNSGRINSNKQGDILNKSKFSSQMVSNWYKTNSAVSNVNISLIDNVKEWMDAIIQSYYKSTTISPIATPSTQSKKHSVINTYTTNWNDEGPNKESYYLDRHPLYCKDNEVLTQFKLNRDASTNKQQYIYKCMALDKKYNKIEKETKFDDDGNGNIYYFDRHNVDCGNNPLVGYRISRDIPNNKIQYKFTCADVKTNDKNKYSTDFKNTFELSKNEGTTINLTEHDIKCTGDKVLNSFKIQRDIPNKTMQIQYECSNIQN
jgi:hypothetical protein